MKQSDLVRYKKKVNMDLVDVDRAISKGAYLSAEEWFDFNFKSALLAFNSLNIVKYRLFNNQVCKFAEACAEAFTFLTDISINGFNNITYIKYVKRIASRMSKFVSNSSPIQADGFDKDGTLYIKVSSGNEVETLCAIRNVDDAFKGIKVIVRYCTEIADTFSHNGEFGKFLDGYVGREFTKFTAYVEPTPYVCGNDRLTLAKQISKRNKSKVVATIHNGDKVISIV